MSSTTTMYEGEVSESVRLTNADFRKLLMTPRVAPSEEPATPAVTARGEDAKLSQTPSSTSSTNKQKSEQRKKRKQHYAKIKKEEDDKLAFLALKYRDRAKERREGGQQDEADEMRNAGAYRAVAPDFKSGLDAAERKQKMIQESKYLGGDMEHTHLVKGLDFALLQKVRSEIEEKELEQALALKVVKAKAKEQKPAATETTAENKPTFRTAMARNLHEMVQLMNTKVMKRNELYAPGRMAYVVELDDDNDAEIPTTLIRSKADVPMIDNTSTLTTNDIVINKLTQILSYLRQGSRPGKKGKKHRDGRMSPEHSLNVPVKGESLSIYDDIGDYVPTLTKSGSSQSSFGGKKTSYFIKPDEDIPVADLDKDNKPRMPKVEELAAIVDAKTEMTNGLSLASASNSYAECYPGLEEVNDTLYDSDEEVDYTKMDKGSNKKGTLSRWDFETDEEYSSYMGQREALPKAAFQYGVKMEDGRKTQRSNNNKGKNDKTKFDKQWQQIQQINKRKYGDSGDDSKFKVPRNF